jgi:glycine/D-amino acid oxidase-like deaminating enzyme
MPEDVYAFGESVHRNLGLVEVPEVTDWEDTAAVNARNAATQHNNYRHYAAANAYEYVQRWEALGRQPEMKEVPGAKGAMKWLNENDLDAAWRQFVRAIEDAIETAEPVPFEEASPIQTTIPRSPGTSEDQRQADSPPPSQSGRGLLGRLFGR